MASQIPRPSKRRRAEAPVQQPPCKRAECVGAPAVAPLPLLEQFVFLRGLSADCPWPEPPATPLEEEVAESAPAENAAGAPPAQLSLRCCSGDVGDAPSAAQEEPQTTRTGGAGAPWPPCKPPLLRVAKHSQGERRTLASPVHWRHEDGLSNPYAAPAPSEAVDSLLGEEDHASWQEAHSVLRQLACLAANAVLGDRPDEAPALREASSPAAVSSPLCVDEVQVEEQLLFVGKHGCLSPWGSALANPPEGPRARGGGAERAFVPMWLRSLPALPGPESPSPLAAPARTASCMSSSVGLAF